MNKLRAKALKVLGGHCVMCGADEVEDLRIDFVDEEGNVEAGRRDNTEMYRRIIEDSNGYYILCAECRKESYEAMKPYKILKDETGVDGKMFGIKT
jgi:hypothetical protein